MRGTVCVGTSGWSYSHWKGSFYPSGLADRDLLGRYAQTFRTTEVNSSFYRLPEIATLESWRRAVPAGFVFSVKASRFITHQKKLKDPVPSTSKFLERISTLGDALGPVLFQLPPRWSFNEQRLAEFLDALPAGQRYAFELRDRSWIGERALAQLADHEAAFCIYELDGFVSPFEVTTDFVYVRLHGPDGAYRGCYAEHVLERWADAISAWSDEGLAVYCYFDNDENGYAAHNAAMLQSLLDQPPSHTPSSHRLDAGT